MCYAVTCNTCGRTTWAGCGRHADQVLAEVPRAQRCPGHTPTQAPTNTTAGKQVTTGPLARIFARRSR